MSYDVDSPCIACNDPAPKGWHYCFKCHLWHAGRTFYDGPDYYQRLHPSLGWLDRQRRYRQGKHDPLESLVQKLMRRIDALERKSVQVLDDRVDRLDCEMGQR